MTYTHRFAWGNNTARARLYGLRCYILASGARGTVVVRFETGEMHAISLRALRKLPVEAAEA